MSILVKASRVLTSQYHYSVVRLNSTIVKKQTIFFDPEVQSLLRGLTGMEFQKVFRLRKLGKKPQRPIYQARACDRFFIVLICQSAVYDGGRAAGGQRGGQEEGGKDAADVSSDGGASLGNNGDTGDRPSTGRL